MTSIPGNSLGVMKMKKSNTGRTSVTALLWACGLASIPSLAQAQLIDANWLTATNGDWFDPSRWSTNPNIPNNGTPAGAEYRAIFAATGNTYTVTLAQAVMLHSMQVTSASARISLDTGGILNTTNGISLSSGRLTVNGGTLRGRVAISSNGRLSLGTSTASVLDGVTIEGPWAINDLAGTSRVRNGLTLNSTVQMFQANSLVFEGNQSITGGTISLSGSTLNYSRLDIEGSSTLTLSPTTSVIGHGTIGDQRYATGTNALINAGTITASTANSAIRIRARSFTNSGTLRAQNGSTLYIENAQSFSNTGAIQLVNGSLVLETQSTLPNVGAVSADAASSVGLTGTLQNASSTFSTASSPVGWTLRGVSVEGGTVRSDNGVAFKVGGGFGNSRFRGVTFENPVEFLRTSEGSGVLELAGVTNIASIVTVNEISRMEFTDAARINSGELRLRADIRTEDSSSLTVGSGASLTAYDGGSIDRPTGSTINQGRLASVGATSLAAIGGTSFLNSGLLEATTGGAVRIYAGSFENQGSIHIGSGSTVTLGDTTLVNGLGTVTREAGSRLEIGGRTNAAGGTLNISNTNALEMRSGHLSNAVLNATGTAAFDVTADSSLTNCTLNGVFPVARDNMDLYLEGTTNLNGTILVTGSRALIGTSIGNTVVNGGEIRLNPSSGPAFLALSSTSFTLGSTARLTGRGEVQRDFSNTVMNVAGTISADIPGQTLSVGPWELNSTGTLEALGGTLSISGITSNIGGTVRIRNGVVVLGYNAGAASPVIRLDPSLNVDREGGDIRISGILDNANRTLALDATKGMWTLDGGTIRGGEVVISEGGGLRVLPSSSSVETLGYLESTTLRGDMTLGLRQNLTVFENLTLDGTITVRAGASLLTDTNVPNNIGRINGGTIVMIEDTSAPNAGIATRGSAIFGPDTTIRGEQPISSSPRMTIGNTAANTRVENEGLIYCDTADRSVYIRSKNFINRGRVEARGAGTVTIFNDSQSEWSNLGGTMSALDGGTLVTGSIVRTENLGTINAADGRWVFNGRMINTNQSLVLGETTTGPIYIGFEGEITGGTVQAPGWTGIITTTGSFRLRDLTVNTDIFLASNTTLFGLGSFGVTGTVTMNPNSTLSIPVGSGSIQSGEFLMRGNSVRPAIVSGANYVAGSVLTLEAPTVFRGGFGEFRTSTTSSLIVNHGSIIADRNGESITIFTDSFDNQGVISAINGGEIIFRSEGNFTENPTDLDISNLCILDSSSSIDVTGVIRLFDASVLRIGFGEATEDRAVLTAGTEMIYDGRLEISLMDGYTPQFGDQWALVSSPVISGSFDSVALSSLPNGLSWDLSALDSGFVSIIPAPMTAGLFAGLGVFSSLRRRSR